MRRLICVFVVTNYRRQFSQSQSNCYISFYHERLKFKMRNLIFLKYEITQTELLFAQSLQSICSVYVDTARVTVSCKWPFSLSNILIFESKHGNL